MNKQNANFIISLIPGSQAAHNLYQVPASVTIAQAILESAWGKSSLTQDAFNLFGIKSDKGWHGDVIMKSTAEYVDGKRIMVQAPFRRYKSFAESMDDHAIFLKKNKRYSKCFDHENGCEFALELFKAGYATDPHYADLLITLIKQHDLMKYDSPYK